MRIGPFDQPPDKSNDQTDVDAGDALARARKRIAQLEADNAALEASVDTRLALARDMADEKSLLRTLIDNMPDQIYVKDTAAMYLAKNSGRDKIEFYPG